MMQSGFNIDGERIQGLQETLDRIRQERQERLENYDLGGVYGSDDFAPLSTERGSLDDLLEKRDNRVMGEGGNNSGNCHKSELTT